MDELCLGDVVRLKSGGPPMTVVDIEESEERIEVAWTDEHGAPQRDKFPLACLQKN